MSTSPDNTYEGDAIDCDRRGRSYSASVSELLLTKIYVSRKGWENAELPIFNDSSSKIDTPAPGPAGGDGGNNSSAWLDVPPSPKEGVGDGDKTWG